MTDSPAESVSLTRKMRFTYIPVLTANTIGALFCTFYFTYLDAPNIRIEMNTTMSVALLMTAGLIVFGGVYGDRWSKNIWSMNELLCRQQDIPPAFLSIIQKKVLQAPLFYALLTMFNWIAAAFIMSGYQCLFHPPDQSTREVIYQALRISFGVLFSGLLTSSIVFFMNDNRFRKFRHLYFPHGGISSITGVPRITVRHRMLFSFVMIGVLPMLMAGVVFYHKTTTSLNLQNTGVMTTTLVTIGLVLVVLLLSSLVLSRLVADSIADPIKEMEAAMNRVRHGDLSVMAKVTDNDELGALAESFNHMIKGLRERDRMRQSLDLAMEVQQNLLPKAAPLMDGVDLAGRSYYCEETGGDYYDFLTGESHLDSGQLGIVVGDVSDHGIQSALLMTTARAFLRQRFHMAGSLSRIVSDVNRQLCLDVEESGQFMTMFLALVDVRTRVLTWVSAGHDPALLYDPARDSFEILTGKGPPLGVINGFEYHESSRELETGWIVAMGTDGIWEAHNEQGHMFGKDRLKEIIRNHAAADAESIQKAVHDAVNAFRGQRTREDDITLVVMKIL